MGPSSGIGRLAGTRTMARIGRLVPRHGRNDTRELDLVRFLTGSRRSDEDERLLWSRDMRFAHRLAAYLPATRSYELDAGIVVIGAGRRPDRRVRRGGRRRQPERRRTAS